MSLDLNKARTLNYISVALPFIYQTTPALSRIIIMGNLESQSHLETRFSGAKKSSDKVNERSLKDFSLKKRYRVKFLIEGCLRKCLKYRNKSWKFPTYAKHKTNVNSWMKRKQTREIILLWRLDTFKELSSSSGRRRRRRRENEAWGHACPWTCSLET